MHSQLYTQLTKITVDDINDCAVDEDSGIFRAWHLHAEFMFDGIPVHYLGTATVTEDGSGDYRWAWEDYDRQDADSLHEACIDAVARMAAEWAANAAHGPVVKAIKELEDKR